MNSSTRSTLAAYLADEALMLAVARKLVALLSLEQAHQIADISDNVVFRQLVVT